MTTPGEPAHGQQVCASCGAGVRLPASVCWMCGRPLVVRTMYGKETPRDENDPTWIIVVIIIAAMLFVVGVALGFEAPGFLIPYAVLALPVVGALTVIAFKRKLPSFGAHPSSQITTSSQADAGQAVRAKQPVAASSTGETVAKALLAVLLVMCAIVALMVVAFVIFAIVCIGIIAASSSGGHF